MSNCPYVKEKGSCPIPSCPACSAGNEDASDKAREKAEKAKAEGNEAYKKGDFKTALRHYSLAVNLMPSNHVFRSNRSAAYSSLQQYKEALDDAQKTIELQPNWPKGYLRAGLAFRGFRYFHLAAEAYEKAIELGEATDKNTATLSELRELAKESGYSKEDEIQTLKEQQNAEKQAQMGESGCCLM